MENLEPKHYKALCCLSSGGTMDEAANIAGVSVAAVKKWKQDPLFEQSLREASSKLYREALAKGRMLLSNAYDELDKIISDPQTNEKIKLQAINILLSHVKPK